jgi:L-histidine Nalpha-methyltransferase
VRIAAIDLVARFEEGESIWTESSYKYTPERVLEMGRAAGFAVGAQWLEEDLRFSTTLFLAR